MTENRPIEQWHLEAAKAIWDADLDNEVNSDKSIARIIAQHQPSPPTGKPQVERDGNWVDKWGACKVCGGEIPYGHTENCDIWKLERAERERDSIQRELDGLKAWVNDARDALLSIAEYWNGETESAFGGASEMQARANAALDKVPKVSLYEAQKPLLDCIEELLEDYTGKLNRNDGTVKRARVLLAADKLSEPKPTERK